jgi:uncharacterized protein
LTTVWSGVSRRSWIEATVALTLTATLASACSSGSGKAETKKPPAPTRTVIATTPTRTVIASPTIKVGIRPTTNRKLDVAFDENAVGASGDQWQATGWNAVATATMLSGAPLNNRAIDFTVSGPINDQSAGALMTIATLALMRGDVLAGGTTAIGTINPDGSIGPVSGLPEKIDAAVRTRNTRVLIPEGQRYTVDASGKNVDVVAGASKGVQVIETPNIYDAYRQLTGKTLPRPAASTNTQLDSSAYGKLRAKVETWTAKYDAALSDFKALSPTVQQDLNPYASAALVEEVRARDLTRAGQQAGAFSAAVNAAALMRSVVQAGGAFSSLLSDGAQAFVTKIKGSAQIQGEISGLVDSLKTFTPHTVTEASALLAAYSNAIDAASLVQYAQYLFKAKGANDSDIASQVAQGAIYYGMAGSLVEAGSDLLAAGQGLGGASLGPKLNVGDIATLLQRAANANLQAFQSGVIAPLAASKKMDINAAVDGFARADTGYALAGTGNALVQKLPAYFGTGDPAAYAQLGGAISLYVRSAVLLAKYQSLGHANPATLQLAGMANGGRAFNVALQHAQSQLSSNLGLLRAEQVNPATVAADSEIGRIDQSGDVQEKFDALADYWDGYVNSRVLIALGGFRQP